MNFFLDKTGGCFIIMIGLFYAKEVDMKKLFAVLALAAMAAVPAMAKSVTLTGADGNPITLDLPDDFAVIVDTYRAIIEDKIKQHGISSGDPALATMQTEINKAYQTMAASLGTMSPYTTAVTGLNEFADILCDAVPNSQIQQNVWANAWIGYLVQLGIGKFTPSFGLGVNAGVAKLDVSPLKRTAQAFGMDTGKLPSTLVMPTATLDLRLGGLKVGGFKLPLDLGFAISVLDSTKLGLDGMISPASFDYFSIAADLRYCVLNLRVLDTKLSVGASYYFTMGNVTVADNKATAGLDFKSSSFSANAQISAKLAFFRPFLGMRFMFTDSSVDWTAKNVNWPLILNNNSAGIEQAVQLGLLPTYFTGGTSGFKFRPVVQGGFCFDIAVIDLTFSASYDFSSNIWGGAFSIRFSL